MRDGIFPGVGCAIAGGLLPLPYAASAYERANALSCCENPGGDGLLLGGIVIPIAVVLLSPAMAWLSGKLTGVSVSLRGVALSIIGAAAGALVGWALFQFLLLPSEIGEVRFGGWGIAPGACVGAGAALGWWIGAELLGRGKVKNG